MKPEFPLECHFCRGTGIYVGIQEDEPGVGVVCIECKGTGEFKNYNGWLDDALNWDVIKPHVRFEGRWTREDIRTVRKAFWWEQETPYSEVAYTEFLEGKLP